LGYRGKQNDTSLETNYRTIGFEKRLLAADNGAMHPRERDGAAILNTPRASSSIKNGGRRKQEWLFHF
jgi:hypothetical protein